MSDIAPFVAATIRDKVVQELIEENKKLRQAMADKEKEQHDEKIHDALYGFSRVLSIAVTGPSPPPGPDTLEDIVVYAIKHVRPAPGGGLIEMDFVSLKKCTLGDLLTAQIFINGIHRPISQLESEFEFQIGMFGDETFTSSHIGIDGFGWFKLLVLRKTFVLDYGHVRT